MAVACLLALGTAPGLAGDPVPAAAPSLPYPPALKAAIHRYQEAQSRVRWAPNDHSLPVLFQVAQGFGARTGDLADQLAEFRAQGLEAVAQLRRDLPLLELADSAPPGPDLDGFLQVARRFHAKESVDFFRLVKEVYPAAGRPIYRSAEGCTRIEEGTVVDLYARFAKARRRWPHCQEPAQVEAARLVDEIVRTKCVCGDADGARQVLAHFVSRFPKDPASARLRARQQTLGSGDDVRFRCAEPP